MVPSPRAGRAWMSRSASTVVDRQLRQWASLSLCMNTQAGTSRQEVVCMARRHFAPDGGAGGRDE